MLATLLGSATRARLLAILLAQPPREHHLRELIRLVDGGASGVQREVDRLEALGLLQTRRSEDGRRLVVAAASHPLLEPLRALLAADAAGGDATTLVTPPGDAEVATLAEAVHPALRPHLAAVHRILREAGVQRAVLFGSTTQPGEASAPGDVDLVIRLGGPARGRAARYFALRRALEEATGLTVDLLEEEAVDNPYLRDEIERTGVTLVAAA